jgi:hypothetical protein
MGAVSHLELERDSGGTSEEDEAIAYLAKIEAEGDRLIAKWEVGEATEQEIAWLIEAGRLAVVEGSQENGG